MSLDRFQSAAAPPVGVVCELVSGIDALYLSGTLGGLVEFDAERFAELVAMKAAVAETGTAQVVVWAGEELHVLPHGLDGWKVALRHENGLIGVTDSPHRPTFRVKPLASFLHSTDPIEAARWFCSLVDTEVGAGLDWVVSRVDLFVDVQGYTFVDEDRLRMVCRSKHHHCHHEDHQLKQIDIGRRTTGTLSARIYDKTRQVRDKGFDYWYFIWGDGFDPTQPVWRIEVEYLRQALKELGVTGLDHLPDRLGGLWAYATEKWLRLTIPSDDQTRARWPTDPVWGCVQRASLRHDAVALERIRQGQQLGSARKLTPQMNGYFTSFAAAIGADTLDDALPAFIEHLEEHADWKGIDVAEQIRCKKAKR